MNKTLMTALIVIVLGGCTTAGAPTPGERVMETQCTDEMVMVCTKLVGATRISQTAAQKQQTCSCH